MIAIGAAGRAAGRAPGPAIREGLGRLRPKRPYRPDRKSWQEQPVDRSDINDLAKLLSTFPDEARPNVIALLKTWWGTFSGSSSSGRPLHRVLVDLGVQGHRFKGKCAELDAIGDALYRLETVVGKPITTIKEARAALNGSRIQTAEVWPPTDKKLHRLGQPKEPCSNEGLGCASILSELGIQYE